LQLWKLDFKKPVLFYGFIIVSAPHLTNKYPTLPQPPALSPIG